MGPSFTWCLNQIDLSEVYEVPFTYFSIPASLLQKITLNHGKTVSSDSAPSLAARTCLARSNIIILAESFSPKSVFCNFYSHRCLTIFSLFSTSSPLFDPPLFIWQTKKPSFEECFRNTPLTAWQCDQMGNRISSIWAIYNNVNLPQASKFCHSSSKYVAKY